MPRSNRRRRDEPSLDVDRVRSGISTVERHADGEWVVRRVSGAGGERAYRCPGCDQLVLPGTPHVVAWPSDTLGAFGGLADRRHWHTPCWTARGRRARR